MAHELSTALGSRQEFVFGSGDAKFGPYWIGPITMEMRGELDLIVAQHFEPPMDACQKRISQLPDMPDSMKSEMWASARTAEARWKTPSCFGGDGQSFLLGNPTGQFEFFRKVIKAYNPDISYERIDELWKQITPVGFQAIWNVAWEIDYDPKDQASPTEKQAESAWRMQYWMEELEAARSQNRWMLPPSSKRPFALQDGPMNNSESSQAVNS